MSHPQNRSTFVVSRETLRSGFTVIKQSVLAVLALSLSLFAQNPTLTAEARSAFVWGQDAPAGAVSSTVEDPLTGDAIRRLSYAGIEVSSRMGFERIGGGEAGVFLNYTTTIVNSTDANVSVRYGGIWVDGRSASSLKVAPGNQHPNKKENRDRESVVELDRLSCFTNGFLSGDASFSASEPSEAVIVSPGAASELSAVFRDPLSYPLRCSIEGCFPTGTIRYYITVNSQDYVFVWPGRSVIYCGK